MRDLHNRHKFDDIAKGKIDTKEKVMKNDPDALHMLNRIRREDENFSHVISSSINNLCPLAQKRKGIGDTDVEKETNVQSRIQKNWFHPHI